MGTQLNDWGERSGGAALLREKISESKQKNDENIADSANQTKIAESNAKNPNFRRI
ncbi:hypothetical protein ACWIUD_01580 [Helicobacter sp. 23-1044]